MAAAVLAVDPWGLAPFGPVKWALVPALVLAAAASVRGVACVARSGAVMWLAFAACVVMAAARAVDPLYAWIGTPERRFGVLTWVLCALAFVVGHRANAAAVATAAAATSAVLGGWVAGELAGWDPVALVGSGDRPVGTLGSSAFMGAAALLLVPAVAAPGRLRWCAAGAVLALAASGARAAWVGAAIAVAVAVLGGRLSLRWAAVGATALVAIALATGTAGRAVDVVTDDRGGVAGRIDEWRVALGVVGDHPITGTGPEGYRIAFGGAVDDAYEVEHGRVPLPDRAHSSVLDVAATLGVPGMLAYLALIAIVGRRLWRAVRTGPAVAAACALAVIGYWAQSLFLFPLGELEPVAWLLAGIAVGRVGDHAVVRIRFGTPARVVWAALAAGALALGALDVTADRAAKRSLATASAPDVARRLRPDSLRYHLAAARVEEERGDLRAAIAAVDGALDLSRRDPVARGERARLVLEQARRGHGDVHDAVAELEAIVADDPRNAEVLLRLGVALALAGDAAGAEKVWLRAERLAPESAAAAANLAVLYLEEGRREDAAAAARRALARDPDAPRARAVLDEVDGT